MSAAENVICFAERRAKVVAVAEEKTTMQEGFIAIPNSVEDALLRSTLTQRQERIFRAILRKTLGYGKTEDCIASSQLAEMTGIHESHVRQALIDLVDAGMVIRGKRSKFGTVLAPVLTPESWISSRTDSVRLPVRSYQIGTNKRTDSAPHNRQIQNTNTTPVVPKASKRPSAGKKTFTAWSADEKAAGRPLVPEDDPVFTYAEQVGIHRDILRLAWQEFRTRYADAGKQYTDWRQTFRNAVRGNWFKLWYFDNGECLLTTAGIQAQKAAEAQA